MRWAAIVLLLVAGCDAFQTGTKGGSGQNNDTRLSPLLRRMQAAYPDLESGRFVSLADFESPGHVGLFRTVGPDGSETDRPQPSLSILRSRNETGAGSLKARFNGPDDIMLFDGKHSQQLALIRDWRKYGLLLMSVYGPPDGTAVEFTVQSGDKAPIRWSRMFRVTPGWNLFRLDTATIGDTIDLADVRVLAWRIPQSPGAVELYFDDIILADNTRHLVGENTGPQELYVFSRGQRIHVGVRERFELAFADGLIVSWREPGGENLADIGGLGPWPVPLPADWHSRGEAPVAYDDPALFAPWGATVAATQRLIEATAFRVVLEGRWRFAAPGTPPPAGATDDDTRPGHTWQYVIYPSGQMYVRVVSRAGQAGWSGPRVGYVIGLDGRRDFRCVQPPPADARGEPPTFVLAARSAPKQSDLLWTWPRTSALGHQRELTSADERRLAVIAGDLEAADVVDTVHLLRLWPTDIDAAPEGASFAADYQNPARLAPTAGNVMTDAPGDLDHDGYNESEGCYELSLADGVLHFDFDPGPHLRFDPVFRVHEAASRRCWVYARGRVASDTGRDAGDNLLFRLAPVVSAPTSVEVHTRAPGAEP